MVELTRGKVDHEDPNGFKYFVPFVHIILVPFISIHMLLSVVSDTSLCMFEGRQSRVPCCIFSYTCRTSQSYWTAAPPCVACPRSRGLAGALVPGEHSRVGQRLPGCDACTGPKSVNICFQHSRCRCRTPCSS